MSHDPLGLATKGGTQDVEGPTFDLQSGPQNRPVCFRIDLRAAFISLATTLLSRA